jgi:enterochelin esterase family protein
MKYYFKKINSLFLPLTFILLLSRCSFWSDTIPRLLEKVNEQDLDQRQQTLLSYLYDHSTYPVIEDSLVWFIYRDSLHQKVYLTGDMADWRPDSIAMQHIEGADFHICSLVCPQDARLEYKFVADSVYYLDPLNKLTERGGFGSNSVFFMPQYRFPQELLVRADLTATTIDTLRYQASLKDTARLVLIYRHAQATASSPLIIFHDGGEYLELASAATILDNLIAGRRIPAVNALFISPKNRMKEYWFNDVFLSMLFNELLPQVKRTYNLSPQKTGMGGASLGGVISLYALLKYGYQLDFVFSQSGALQIENDRILRQLNDWNPATSRVWFDFGVYEGMQTRHDRLRELLAAKNARFGFNSCNEGHNWGNWRAHLPAALEFGLRDK